MTPDEREDAKLSLDQERYELDKRRVTAEETKSRTDNLFLNRKLPALVTMIVSASAVFFSYVQMRVAANEKTRELDVVKEKNDQEFKLAVAKFVTEHSKDIFEGTDEQQQRIRNVILASFPAEVSNTLFAQLAQSASTPQAASTWSEGQKVAAEASGVKPENAVSDVHRVYLHYQDEADAGLVDSLMSLLRAKGYRVPGRQLVTQATQGDIRYYHDDDEETKTLNDIAATVEQFLSDSKRPLGLKRIFLGKQYPNMPKGVFEVWLPKKL